MRNKQEYETTSNRLIYNRTRKIYLSRKRNGIGCPYCRYHSNENSTDKWYRIDESSKFPSWKLCSKNKYQWQSKPLKFKEHKNKINGESYFDILW